MSYGTNTKAFVSYIMNYQLLPFQRAQELLMNVFSLPISEGTLANIRNELAGKLNQFVEHSRDELSKSPVINNDETSININGVRYWLHVASNKFITLLFPHAKRGKEAVDAFGILSSYNGIAVHDCWKTYFTYRNCQHALCNAHILRELKFFTEQDKYLWSDRLAKLLIEIKDLCDNNRFKGVNFLSDDVLNIVENGYDIIVKDGFVELLSRGTIEENIKAYNLLKRLRYRKANILYFAYNFNVPFDNNQAEQDLRMEKLRQKISGVIKNFENALNITKIRSYLKTSRKNNINVLDAFASAFAGNPFIPKRC